MFAYLYPAITRPYGGGLPLIAPSPERDRVVFVQSVFDRFRLKKIERCLAMICQACPDVRTQGFLDTRCLQILSQIEYIIGRDAALAGESTSLPITVFDPLVLNLKRAIREVLILAFPTLQSAEATRMADHVQGMNYVSFRRRLNRAARRLDVHVSRQEIGALQETRNRLVHRALFATNNPWEEFARALSVADRLLMGLLG